MLISQKPREDQCCPAVSSTHTWRHTPTPLAGVGGRRQGAGWGGKVGGLRIVEALRPPAPARCAAAYVCCRRTRRAGARPRERDGGGKGVPLRRRLEERAAEEEAVARSWAPRESLVHRSREVLRCSFPEAAISRSRNGRRRA